MKLIYNTLLFILYVSTLMSLTSCDVHHWPHDGRSDLDHTLTLTFETDAFDHYQTVTLSPSEKSRASDELPYHNLRYIIRVYKHDPQYSAPGILSSNVRNYHESVEEYDGVISDFTLPLDLEPGEYDVVAWCEYIPQDGQEDFYHDTSDFYELSYCNVGAEDYEHKGNTTFREAWRGSVRIVVAETGHVTVDGIDSDDVENVIVNMERPMARFHFVTTDLDKFNSIFGSPDNTEVKSGQPLLDRILEEYVFKIRYAAYMPSHMNILSDKTVNSATGVSFECMPALVDEENTQLGFDYVFVGKPDTSVQVALDIYRKKTGEMLSTTGIINAPLRRGHYTVITGNLLTGNAGAGIGIDTKFDGDYIIEIF